MKTPRSSGRNALPTPVRLPAHVTISDVSAACRDAWRVFVEQSEEWRKAEQVLWSAGLYAPIRRFSVSTAHRVDAEHEDDFKTVDSRFLERMILTARAKAFDILTSFALPRARLAFGMRMREEGLVSRCEDRFGNTGYVPTPLSGSLTDRILALIACDLLNRPGDFEGETLCSNCGGVVVGPTPCCTRYEGRDTCAPSRRYDTVAVPYRTAG
jgi:hypothetical protein